MERRREKEIRSSAQVGMDSQKLKRTGAKYGAWVQQNEAIQLLNMSSASRRKTNTRDEFQWF